MLQTGYKGVYTKIFMYMYMYKRKNIKGFPPKMEIQALYLCVYIYIYIHGSIYMYGNIFV